MRFPSALPLFFSSIGLAMLTSAGPLPAAELQAQDGKSPSIYHLPLGDPARREREVPITIDTLVDTVSGLSIEPEALAGLLTSTRLLLLGESHTSVEAHHVQLQVLQALQRRGRRMIIALEMFPVTAQAALDEWNAGRLSESEFLVQSRWYEHWGYDWRYYREIFLFARDHRIPLHAVNVPRAVVTAVRQKGIANLPPDQAAYLPPRVDVDSAEHLALFKASFGSGDGPHGAMTEDAWQGMLAAQATWDAGMGWNTLQALKRLDDPAAVGIVLVGSGHVAYGLGIERQARPWTDGPIASVIPVPVADENGPITAVRASYARYVWGVPREPWSAWPSLGVSTSAAEDGRKVIHVEDDSPAAAASLEVGDVIVAIDDEPTPSREALSRAMASRLWGDVVHVTIRRSAGDVRLVVPLRRQPLP